MTSTTKTALDQLGANLKTANCSMTTANIYDGVKERFDSRGSITPKQAVWTLDHFESANISIPGDFKQHVEIPGTDLQKSAYSKVEARLPVQPDINDRAVEDIMMAGTIVESDVQTESSGHTRTQLLDELQSIRESVMRLNDLITNSKQF